MPFYRASPAYSGPGPHKLIGFDDEDESNNNNILDNDPPDLPSSWTSSGHGDDFEWAHEQSDYEHVQLAVCMSGPKVTGKVVGKCSYGSLTIGTQPSMELDLVSASYEFKVFETKTGRLVKSFEVGGSNIDYCPTEVDSRENRKIAQAADAGELAAELRPLVKGAA